MKPAAKKRQSSFDPARGKIRARSATRLGPRFLRAFLFAAEKHSSQTRKASTIPYVAHLMGVASLVLEAGGDEDLAIAALLHDVVEDCGGAHMLKEVRRRFGKRVATIVEGCTDADTDPKPPWRERKETYIRRLKTADADTRLVSAADKLNNVRSILSDYRAIGGSVWSRFNGGREGTLWYYRTLREVFLGHTRNRITRDFELAVSELDSLARGRPIPSGTSSQPFVEA
ncbi:MAG: HD domain-containing protein [Candidatus Sulfotelmatobacter sp.]